MPSSGGTAVGGGTRFVSSFCLHLTVCGNCEVWRASRCFPDKTLGPAAIHHHFRARKRAVMASHVAGRNFHGGGRVLGCERFDPRK